MASKVPGAYLQSGKEAILLLHVADAFGVPPAIPHPHHFASHHLNSSCRHCIYLPYGFLWFSRAHFAHLYENQRSLAESKPMTDENWTIKHLSPHPCQQIWVFYPGCQFPGEIKLHSPTVVTCCLTHSLVETSLP